MVAVLILAGRRSGVPDPLARAAGVSHKALVPVAGRPMIAQVAARVRAALPGARLFVSTDAPEALAGVLPEPISFVAAGSTLADSVARAARVAGTPLLVTTADAVLLTSEAIRAAASSEADALVTLVPVEAVRAAHPDAAPTGYAFRDGRFAGCNLYRAGTDAALAAAEAFRNGGQFVKVPLRIVRTFGPLNLLRFLSRGYALEEGFAIISRRLGVRVQPLVLGDGRLAIDIDDARTLRIAEDLLR